MLHESLLEDARALTGDIVALRRAIHAEPELGLDTPLTRDKVRAALAHLPLEWTEGSSTTGIVGTLKGGAGTPLWYMLYQSLLLNALLVLSVSMHNAAARRIAARIGA